MCFSLSETPINFFFFLENVFGLLQSISSTFGLLIKECVVLVLLAYEILVINIIIKLCPHFFSVEQNISMFDDAEKILKNKLQGFDF